MGSTLADAATLVIAPSRLAVWNAADVAGTLPHVDGFAVWHCSCLIVAELFFFGSATLPAAALMVRRLLLAMRQLIPWYSQASTVSPSRAVGAFIRRRDGLDPRRRCDSRHRFESLAVWNAADVAGTLPRVDGFAVRHRSCLIVTELFFGSATLPAAARHGAPPAAGDAAADASGVAKHRRFHRQAPWALFIVVVMCSFFADAATSSAPP